SAERRSRRTVWWVMRSLGGVDIAGMTSKPRTNSSATDGEWMDVAFAATYAGVPLHVLTSALRAGELPRSATWGSVGAILLHSHAVEAWAAERESKTVALAS
ncbi:MAG: hypothetical protein QOD68_2006, partial [Actinomycetota bacterium]|nr:hypothetical protein [Actinomycetota bacterium]